MNLRKAYRLTSVLTLSQLRSTRGAPGGQVSLFRRPIVIVAVDLALFGLAYLVGLALAAILRALSSPAALVALASEATEGLPLFVLFFGVFVGVLWEVNVSPAFASTDQINWLPITASEYVVASAASLAFVYSPILAFGLGPIMALASAASLPIVWVAAVPFGFLALATGALAIEILRAATNRLSTVISRRSGRTTLAFRMIVLVFALTGYQLLFNPQFLSFLFTSAGAGTRTVGFIPILWATIALRSLLEGQALVGVLFGVLAVLFPFLLFGAAVKLRQRYWIPVPVTVKLRGAKVATRAGILARVGFNPAEAAIVRKDLRALTRRREMASILAIPAVMMASVLATNLSSPALAQSRLGYLWVLPLTYAIGFFVFLHSMMSVGQEGSAVWNLYASPVSPRELVRAKAGTTLVLALPAAVLAWLGVTLLIHPSYRGSLAVLFSLSELAAVGTFLGLAMAIRFPDFSDAGRSRFVQVSGAMLGAIIGLIAFGAVLAPYGVYLFLFAAGPGRDVPFFILSGISVSICVALVAAFRSSCLGNARRLLYALPV